MQDLSLPAVRAPAEAKHWAASNMRLEVLTIVVLLFCASCAQKNAEPPNAQVSTRSNVDLNKVLDNDLLAHVGESVTLHGTWSLRGIVGPYILANDREIYVVSKGNFSWGEKYARMEGKDVRITGVLQYERYEPSTAQHPPDHFYFEAKTAKIELNEK
jgi:hypothetical protein